MRPGAARPVLQPRAQRAQKALACSQSRRSWSFQSASKPAASASAEACVNAVAIRSYTIAMRPLATAYTSPGPHAKRFE